MLNQRIDINQTHIRLTTDIKSHGLNLLIYGIHNDLNRFISLNSDFLLSLSSLEYRNKNLPAIVDLMVSSSKKTGVGPMACVAGSISEMCINSLMNSGSKYSIVENGGDIAILNNRTALCGIYSNNPVIKNEIAFRIRPRKVPLGICTSSGKIGHSISFGVSDSVTVIAKSSSIADGLATNIANEVKGDNSNDAITNALDKCESYRELFDGALIISGDNIGTIGKLPKLVRTNEFRLDKI